MYGFKFGTKHSSEFGIIMKSVNRSVLPAKRSRNIEIPGRHGKYDFGGNTYDVRSIEIEIAVLEPTPNELRKKIRKIAQWLSQKGRLVFDDEPDKYYIAQLYGSLKLEQFATSGKIPLVFECEPFALADTVEQLFSITDNKSKQTFIYNGTQETCCRVILTNKGNNSITGLNLLIGGSDNE